MAKHKTPLPVSIQPMDYADIPTCSRYVADAFALDPHTVVKQLGRNGYDMHAISVDGLFAGLEKKTQVNVKAVDNETDEAVGHASWTFRGFSDDVDIDWVGPSDEKPAEQPKTESTQDEKDREHLEGGRIDELHALEDTSMRDWLKNGIPADTPCIIVLSLAVAPSHQSRGVGSALLQHGNALADALGVPIWVHSSHQACKAYQKAGFAVTSELVVDLDEYAPRPPREGESVMGDKGAGLWGTYVISYMKRTPKTAVVQFQA